MIYADSGIIIRWVEGADEIRDPLKARWKRLPSGDRLLITSRLARLECRCGPLRDQDDELLQLYDLFFAGKEVKVLEIDAAVIEEATAVRARIGLKAPDAIHAATARLAGAAEFWTADRHFVKCPGLRVELFKAV